MRRRGIPTFSLPGAIGVVTNPVVAFVPLGLLLAESMKLPKEIGTGLVYLGTYAGVNTGIPNPVKTGSSQRMAAQCIACDFNNFSHPARVDQFAMI